MQNTRTKTGRELAVNVMKYSVMIVSCVIILLPIVVVFFGSFKTHTEFYDSNPLSPPASFLNFDNYKAVFVEGKLLTGFINTAIIMVISLTGSILSGTTIAYVFSRFQFRGKKILQNMFLFAALVPGVTMQVTVFQVINQLGAFNTLMAPILLYIGTDIMAIYIFMQFIDSISKDLDEAALIEGASYFRVFFKIILPLLKPAIVTIIIISGTTIYNDFYTAFLYMPSADLATISTSLFNFKGPYASSWEIILAGIIVVMFPMLIVFLTLQKYIYNGLTAGSVK